MPRVNRLTLGAVATVIAALAMLTLSFASAEDVTVSVTPTGVAIAIDDGNVLFGTQALGSTVATPADTASETIHNTGAAAIANITVGYSNGTEGDCGWQADASAVGEDQFVMSTKTDGSFGAIPVNPGDTGDIQTASIATSGTQALDFELQMPDSVTTGNSACSILVTVTAAVS
jgi:3-deoxy-D-arabino-heptulosonate 7-phosphate (DAHP) synthase